MFRSKKPKLTNAYIKNRLDMAYERGKPSNNHISDIKNVSLEMVMRHVLFKKNVSRNKIMENIKIYNQGFTDEQALKYDLYSYYYVH